MFPTNPALDVNVAKGDENVNKTSYCSPKIFVVGSAATLIQGPMNSSTIRDAYGQWYAYTYDR